MPPRKDRIASIEVGLEILRNLGYKNINLDDLDSYSVQSDSYFVLSHELWRKGSHLTYPPHPKYLSPDPRKFTNTDIFQDLQIAIDTIHHRHDSDYEVPLYRDISSKLAHIKQELNKVQSKLTSSQNRIANQQIFRKQLESVADLRSFMDFIIEYLQKGGSQPTQKDISIKSVVMIGLSQLITIDLSLFPWSLMSEVKYWLAEVQSLLHIQPKRSLWSKFFKKSIMPKISSTLKISNTFEICELSHKLIETALLENSDMPEYFEKVVKPHLLFHLEELKNQGALPLWIDLSSLLGCSNQIAIITKMYVQNILKGWIPPNPLGLRVYKEWSYALKYSSDFLSSVIVPKLAISISNGSLSPLMDWIEQLDEEMTVSLIARHFLGSQIKNLADLAKKEPSSAARAYADLRRQIPSTLIKAKLIQTNLLHLLSILRDRNAFLQAIKFKPTDQQASVRALLENISEGKILQEDRSYPDRISFKIGKHTVSFYSGALFLLRGTTWDPVYVDELRHLLTAPDT